MLPSPDLTPLVALVPDILPKYDEPPAPDPPDPQVLPPPPP